MRDHRNNRAHEEVVVIGGAAPHGWPQVTQEGHFGRAGERGKTWARGGRRKTRWQRIAGYLASRGTGAPPYLTLGSDTAQYVKVALGLCPHG